MERLESLSLKCILINNVHVHEFIAHLCDITSTTTTLEKKLEYYSNLCLFYSTLDELLPNVIIDICKKIDKIYTYNSLLIEDNFIEHMVIKLICSRCVNIFNDCFPSHLITEETIRATILSSSYLNKSTLSHLIDICRQKSLLSNVYELLLDRHLNTINCILLASKLPISDERLILRMIDVCDSFEIHLLHMQLVRSRLCLDIKIIETMISKCESINIPDLANSLTCLDSNIISLLIKRCYDLLILKLLKILIERHAKFTRELIDITIEHTNELLVHCLPHFFSSLRSDCEQECCISREQLIRIIQKSNINGMRQIRVCGGDISFTDYILNLNDEILTSALIAKFFN